MNKDVRYILVSVTLIGLATMGCQSTEQKKIAQLHQFLQKDRSPVGAVEYRVLPPDVINVTSHNVQEITDVVQQIRPDGKISLPLIGELFVAGLTPQEIRREIIAVAQKYYKKVDVTVFVTGFNSQKVYVFGEVYRPGPMPWTGSDTLLDVLAQVQPTLMAWPEKVKVVRGRQPKRGGYIAGDPESDPGYNAEPASGEVRNEQGAQELTVDLMAMVKSGDMTHNILLQPDDVVYVPPNPFAAVGLGIQQILFPTRGVVDMVQAPGDVDTEYWYWKNRKDINTINVRNTGSGASYYGR